MFFTYSNMNEVPIIIGKVHLVIDNLNWYALQVLIRQREPYPLSGKL